MTKFKVGDEVVKFMEDGRILPRGRIIKRIHPACFKFQVTHLNTEGTGRVWHSLEAIRQPSYTLLAHPSELTLFTTEAEARAEHLRRVKEWREANPDRAKAKDAEAKAQKRQSRETWRELGKIWSGRQR